MMWKLVFLFFFFSSRRRHTRLTCDWSSDVCSSDLDVHARHLVIVEIALLDAAVLERDLRQERVARAHHASALHLRAHTFRSEERRVGKECRCRWWSYY